ncbi:MAG TPA: phosphoribosylglycinamide formyltransferase [Phycisphaerae bacterium]|nr:phosphoribosylglycinamide formyltransferase [Phycisphaerae bacterium]
MSAPFRIAVMISGEGTGLQNLIDCIASGRLSGIEIALVISSRADAGGLARADRAGLTTRIIRPADFPDTDAFSTAIAEALDDAEIDLAVQAGWLCYWKLPEHWLGRVINIHPALLPKYGGKGFYGRRVHEAVIAAGDQQSGATVHWVDNEYDHGEIIAQQKCAVKAGDTCDMLAERVRALEFDLLPTAIAGIAAGVIRHKGQ